MNDRGRLSLYAVEGAKYESAREHGMHALRQLLRVRAAGCRRERQGRQPVPGTHRSGSNSAGVRTSHAVESRENSKCRRQCSAHHRQHLIPLSLYTAGRNSNIGVRPTEFTGFPDSAHTAPTDPIYSGWTLILGTPSVLRVIEPCPHRHPFGVVGAGSLCGRRTT